MARTILRIQNVYGDFLRSFKVFLDEITRGSLNKIEWNYGAKPLEYYYMMNGHESFEYPIALVDIQDIQPVDGVGAISRNPGLNPNFSVHNIEIAGNASKLETIILDKRWVNLLFTVTINTEDTSMLLHYHDLFMGNLPMNFHFYDYKYYGYIEVTDYVLDWDFDNDDIENVFIKYDPTFRYNPDVIYSESNEDFMTTKERDRVLGRDPYPELEGKRYFAMVQFEPILKFTGLQKQTDKESSVHSLTLNFEARMEIPNLLIGHIGHEIQSMEIVIDTVSKHHQDNPILIDIPENFLTNKNISRGILLSSSNFVIPEDPVFDPTDPDWIPDPTKYAHLVIPEVINPQVEVPALWAVEDVTETSASRLFIPLKHSKIEQVLDTNGIPIATRLYFKEMQWFELFDFNNPFNYLKLVMFSEDQS